MTGRMRWQYRVVSLGAFFAAGRLNAVLGELGADGWELVHVYDKTSNWIVNMENGFAIFKRPVDPGDEPEGPWSSTKATVGMNENTRLRETEANVDGWM